MAFKIEKHKNRPALFDIGCFSVLLLFFLQPLKKSTVMAEHETTSAQANNTLK